MGHGLIWILFGSYLCIANNSLKKTALKDLLAARYFFTMMGFFACYCGFMYNDFMSINLNFFGSCYTNVDKDENTYDNTNQTDECVYPFGIDPIWGLASNEISFINNYKMKLAVILGIAHMMFGIFLRGWNAINNRSVLDFVFEFIPMFIFMCVTFVFMDVLIILKWT